jgi:uncharacterized delta-60 repeat protein
MKNLPVLVGLLFAAFSPKAFAQPATALDSSFSQDGILDVDSLRLTSVGKIYLALQSDGKILTAGTYAYWPTTGQHQMGALLTRFLANGDRDSSFGQDGELMLAGNGNENCIGLQLLPDGRIVTATASSVFQGNRYTLYRVLPSGAPDASFNDSGKVVFAPTLTQGHIYYNALAVQPDGGILLTGHWSVPPLYHFLNTFRHTTAGVPDSAYGLYGRASVELFNTYKIDGRVIAVQPDGSFLIGGLVQDTPLSFNRNKALLARCLPSGALDTGFGTGLGFFKHATPGQRHSAVTSVIVRPNGKILAAVVTQNSFEGSWTISVLQLTTSGLLDVSFGNGGIAIADSSSDDAAWKYPPQLALQADGRTLISFADGMDAATGRFAVRRLTASGAPDNSFGAGGKVVTRVSASRPGGATSIAVQPNGKILTAGTSEHAMSGYTTLGIARYHPYIFFTGLLSEPDKPTLHLYPNPTSGAVRLEYSLPALADVRICLQDVQGRTQQTFLRAHQAPGIHSEELAFSELPPGSYILSVRGGNYASSAVVVKQ